MPVRPGFRPTPGAANAPSGTRCGEREKERRGADVAGHAQPERLERSGVHRHPGVAGIHPDTAHREQPLGVVASGERLDDRRRAVGRQGGEQDRGLHLRARHRCSPGDPGERSTAADPQRGCPSGRRLHVGPHGAERVDDARHRTASQRGVAVERGLAVATRECPGEQAHRGPRVRRSRAPSRGSAG